MSDGEFQPLTWLRAVLSEACTLDPSEGIVMLALVRHADEQGRAWPGFTTLSRETRVGRTKLVKSLAALEARGMFARRKQTRGQGFGSNVYELPVTPPTSALGALPEATTRPPRELGSAPRGLPLGRHAAPGSAPREPYLPIELPSVTAQGTAGAPPSAPHALPTKPTRASGTKPKPRPRATEVALPDDWKPSEAHVAFAKQHGLDVELEAIAFRGHFEGKTALSWNGRFTTWLANQAKWNKERGPRRVPAPQRGVANEAEAQQWGRNGPLHQAMRGAE